MSGKRQDNWKELVDHTYCLTFHSSGICSGVVLSAGLEDSLYGHGIHYAGRY